MKKHLLKFLLAFFIALFISAGWVNGQVPNAWINEVHYDNTGTDAGEGIEIVVENPGSWDLSLLVFTLYNGGDQLADNSYSVSTFTVGNTYGNFLIYSMLISGIQNGAPDGFSLNYDGVLIQFLSYEGTFTALDGPATGITSTDIGVLEAGADPLGESLQLSGTGSQYSNFTWQGSATETFGSANNSQTFGADVTAPVATWDPVDAATDVTITTDITITFDEAIRNIDDSEITDGNVATLLVLKETDGSGSDVAFTATIDGDKKVITINPDADLANNQLYYVAIAAVEDASDNATIGENITFTTIAAKPQPTNHVTSFTATAHTYNNIELTWTDALEGTQFPDAYLIKASTGAITAPVDGTDPTEDTDLSDGEAIVKVLHGGDEAYTFDGLTAGATYNFQIWSYTNDGASIDFLDGGPTANIATSSTELFFSEYIEGSGTNKALEFYNPTGITINLDDYMFLGTSNASTGWEYDYSFQPGATIAPGEVYIIVDDGAIQEMKDLADYVTPDYEVSFTGNDARGLFKIIGTDNVLIDIIGTYDNASGSNFDVAGTTGATAEHTLIRKTGRTYGNTDWTSSAGTTEGDSEWIVMSQDYINNLGAYRDVSTDATLSDLTVDATTITAFASGTYTYNEELAYGTTVVPTVAGTATDATYATVDVVQAQNLTGTEAERTATITVTADDLSTQDYTVVFSVAQNTENDILTFVFETFEPDVDGVVDAGAHTVTLTVPYGTDVTALVPTITVSADATISPLTGVAQDFSSPVDYTVTAQDATDQIWTVTVNVELNTENDILTFIFETFEPDVDGVVDAGLHTVTATVPFGTDVTALVPTITVSSDATISPLTGVEQDFTIPVEYTVTAEDATDQIWTVTVTVASNDAKELTSFSFVDPAVDGVITELDHTVAVEVPFGTNVTALVANFGTTGKEVKVETTVQVSGTTANDFTSPVTYIVVAADDSEQNYIVTVSITAASTDATLSDLTIDATTVAGFDAAILDYNVELPYGTTDEPVVAATETDANANAVVTQATDVEGDLAARTATIVVTAEDGTTTKTYTVVFTVALNDDARLSNLKVDGETISGFDEAIYEYNVELPSGTTDEPVVSATTYDTNANAVITQATDVEGDLAARTATVVVTAEDGTTELTYSIVFSVGSEGGLFFSEYVEGSSNNKALEIYNPTNETVDLTTYIIRGTGNEATYWEYDYPFPAGSTVAAKSVFVIVDDGASQAMQDLADWIDDGYTCGFNGNDSRGLFKIEGTDSTLIDIIGFYNNPSADYYEVAGISNGLAEHTILRKTSTTIGNTDWTSSAGTNADDSEWVVFDADYIDDLGNFGLKSGTDILTYTFVEQTGPATINATAHTVAIEVAFGTSPSALVATFTLSSDASAKVGATDQVSGTTANDFSSPVTYTVTAEDASTQDWVVTVTVATTQSDFKEITNFTVEGMIGTANIESGAGTVTATVEYGTDITSLKPVFEVSALATIADTAAARDFTTAQTYVVTAEDASTKDWVVTISVETVTDVADIAALRALYSETNETIYKITGEVTFTFATSPYFYIQDASAAILIYNGNSAITTTYDIGDNVQNLIGTFDTFGGNMQFALNSDPGTAISTGNTVTALAVTIPVLASNYDAYDAELIKLEDVTFTETGTFASGTNYTLNNGSDQIALRTNFSEADYIGTNIPTETLDVTAIAGIYNGTVQVYPRLLTDFVIVTGISNPDGIVSMNIYPNPSNGNFTLEMNASKAGTFNIEIINIQGQVVFTKQINQDGFYKETIDISNNASGIYYLRINDGKNFKVSKIIIQ